MDHEGHADPLQRMNENHADDLVVIARAFGHPDATAARVERIDRRGLDLVVHTPHSSSAARVDFSEPISEGDYPEGVRVAFVRLARRGRTALSPRGQRSDDR